MGRHRRTTCPHCNHQIAKLTVHEPMCAKRTPEEREVQWRIIEQRRRHQSKKARAEATKVPTPTGNVYEDLVKQLQALYPQGIPTKDGAKLLATVQWVFTTFHMLKQRAS